eukprot:2338936-Pyramimonas_sp.AAC.1
MQVSNCPLLDQAASLAQGKRVAVLEQCVPSNFITEVHGSHQRLEYLFARRVPDNQRAPQHDTVGLGAPVHPSDLRDHSWVRVKVVAGVISRRSALIS